MKIRVAGADPSLKNFGIALGYLDIKTMTLEIDHLEVVKSEANPDKKKSVRVNSDDLRRARDIYTGAKHLLEEPALVFAELPVGSQSSRAQTSYGICLGVIASIEKPLIELTPAEVKLAAAGKNASKAEMIKWAMTKHPEAPWKMRKLKGELVSIDGENEHLADAVAAIYAGLKTQQFKQTLNMLIYLQQTGASA